MNWFDKLTMCVLLSLALNTSLCYGFDLLIVMMPKIWFGHGLELRWDGWSYGVEYKMDREQGLFADVKKTFWSLDTKIAYVEVENNLIVCCCWKNILNDDNWQIASLQLDPKIFSELTWTWPPNKLESGYLRFALSRSIAYISSRVHLTEIDVKCPERDR